MSWRDRAQQALSGGHVLEKGATQALTKPTKAPSVSSVSTPMAPIKTNGDDLTAEEFAEIDRLIHEVAELERWPKSELDRVLDERRRMAQVNARRALRRLGATRSAALAPWPKTPQRRSNVVLCELRVIEGGKK